MEPKIAKPYMVKGIPSLVIRPLPALYYYGKYHNTADSHKITQYFDQNLQYLKQAAELLASEINSHAFNPVIQLITELPVHDKQNISEKVITITSELSKNCQFYQTEIRTNPNLSKNRLGQLYQSIVQPLQILLIDYNREPGRILSIKRHLTETCYYLVQTGRIHSTNFLDYLHKARFVLFSSCYPITINEDVAFIQQYKKPLMILADIKKDKKVDQQTIRNGAWLQNKGFNVLYKIFTPLRLFTSIDKHYIHYNLSNA